MGKSRAKAKEEEKKKLKKERIRKALILAAIGLAVLIVYLIIACMPLDEMTDYRVHVTPQDDGSLEITYSYEWKTSQLGEAGHGESQLCGKGVWRSGRWNPLPAVRIF